MVSHKELKVNYEITTPEVHLILDDGRSIGVVSLAKARFLAAEKHLDLVELNGSARPPIVKLMDYNRYRYQQEKQARQKVRSVNELKEIRIGFKTDDNDLKIKAKKASKFLTDGHFVRVFINLRGRENLFPDKAKEVLKNFQEQIGAEIEQPISHEGKKVQVIFKQRKDNAKNKDS